MHLCDVAKCDTLDVKIEHFIQQAVAVRDAVGMLIHSEGGGL